jgi:hypothetical protein
MELPEESAPMKPFILVTAAVTSMAVASAAPSLAQEARGPDTPAQSSASAMPANCPMRGTGGDASAMGQMPQGMMGGQPMMQMMHQMHAEMQQMHTEITQMHRELRQRRR